MPGFYIVATLAFNELIQFIKTLNMRSKIWRRFLKEEPTLVNFPSVKKMIPRHLFPENLPNVTAATEAFVQRYSIKKVFLRMLQNLQANTCAGVSF